MTSSRRTLLASGLGLLLLPGVPALAQPRARGRVTSRAMLPFAPRSMAGVRASTREVRDDHLVFAAYRTPTGYINLNLAFSRNLAFDRAQVAGSESDELVRNDRVGFERQGVAVGRHRALLHRFLSGSKTELNLFLGDRINVGLSREGSIATADMVALAGELDLDGLARLAPRVPAPTE